jgi:hypothetical protein
LHRINRNILGGKAFHAAGFAEVVFRKKLLFPSEDAGYRARSNQGER